MSAVTLAAGTRRILVLCGNDAAAVTAANIYAERLHGHDLLFLEERLLTPGRAATFCRRRMRAKGLVSLLGSIAYVGLHLACSAPVPPKRYRPRRTTRNFNTDPSIRAHIHDFKPDVALVCSCGVLGPKLLALLPDATYNIHPGINPAYRGFGNIWALAENRLDRIGYTIHTVDAGIDTGARIAVVPLGPRDLATTRFTDLDLPVFARAARHMATLLLGTGTASIPDDLRDLPSRYYGLPTLACCRAARTRLAAALRTAPRHVLITGASSGLGAALAVQYAAPGVRLTLWARDAQRLDLVAARCRARGAAVQTISQDVRDLDASSTALHRLDAEAPIDLAVLGAGVSSGTLPDNTPEPAHDAARTLTVNATAAIHMAATLFALMRPRGTGHVACVSSIAALFPLPDSPAYSAAKAALSHYARAMRPHVRPVRVSVIYPGYIDTPMSRRLTGPQPLRWSAEKAAARIRSRLDAGAESVIFPLPLACGTWLLNLLPASVSAFFLRRFGFSIRPDEADPASGAASGGDHG